MFASKIALLVIILVALGTLSAVLILDKALRLAFLFWRERRFASDAQLAISADELADVALRHPLAPGARMIAALAVETLPVHHPRRESTLWSVSRREAARSEERAHEWLPLSACLVLSLPALGALMSALAYVAMATPSVIASWGAGARWIPTGTTQITWTLSPLIAGLGLFVPLFWAQRAVERAAARLSARLRCGVDEWVERLLATEAPAIVEAAPPPEHRHFAFEIRTRHRGYPAGEGHRSR